MRRDWSRIRRLENRPKENSDDLPSAARPVALVRIRRPGRLPTPTIVTLNDGREIQAVDTPRYDRSSGFYELEQLDGKRTRVNKDQVRSIKDM